ncbi:MAG: glucose-1-phosphate thymidylyltransferase [Spirochaetia bacterium]|nr:glucose-1-phosphate thymidylyltransferase [Spirochaetia bacterium]
MLNDSFEPVLLPLFRLKPAFTYADGIFSPMDRFIFELKTIKNNENNLIIFKNERKNAKTFYHDYLNSKNLTFNIKISEKKSNTSIGPSQIINNFEQNIIHDLKYIKKNEYSFKPAEQFCLYGKKEDLFIGNNTDISSMAVIDCREGPVIIDNNVKISAFSHIIGPVYIGAFSQLDRVFLKKSRIGFNCRIGGEIEKSLLGNFTNKHHEGFIGHTLIGDWVNLGALTTTSDLKNNYSEIRMYYKDIKYSTGTIKLGSIIGDFVKTSIGTFLNTGTVIDTASLLYNDRKHFKYYPPFFWGGSESKIYEFNKFIKDCNIIMKRRNEKLNSFMLKELKKTYEETSLLKTL